nr:MAG TPA: hypothetical protein [Caudoviricetes sp.]
MTDGHFRQMRLPSALAHVMHVHAKVILRRHSMQAKRCDNCNKKLFEYNNLTISCEKANKRQEELAICCPRCKIINRVTVVELRNVNKPA